ncbi:hypothetical protein GTY47_05965 [Streptomyces sp. SID5464]|nr:hypothetical protein [Streptomyces sp. SID5464]
MLRALVEWARGHGGDAGGATLVQQLARMLYTYGQRTRRDQLEQVALAVKLAHAYPKSEILRMYLSTCLLYTSAVQSAGPTPESPAVKRVPRSSSRLAGHSTPSYKAQDSPSATVNATAVAVSAGSTPRCGDVPSRSVPIRRTSR